MVKNKETVDVWIEDKNEPNFVTTNSNTVERIKVFDNSNHDRDSDPVKNIKKSNKREENYTTKEIII